MEVQTPNGATQSLAVQPAHDGDLYGRLRVNQQVNAQLWNGSIIELDDSAGHS